MIAFLRLDIQFNTMYYYVIVLFLILRNKIGENYGNFERKRDVSKKF